MALHISAISVLPLDELIAKIQDAKKAGVTLSPMQMIADDLKIMDGTDL